MTPETGHFLDKARKLLGEADAMLTLNLNDAAGRTAHLAGFHDANAQRRSIRAVSIDQERSGFRTRSARVSVASL